MTTTSGPIVLLRAIPRVTAAALFCAAGALPACGAANDSTGFEPGDDLPVAEMAPDPASNPGTGGGQTEQPVDNPPTAPPATTGAVPVQPPADLPVPDPNVIFEWPETDPAARGACEPGLYIGQFSCAWRDPQNPLSNVEVLGPVSFTLRESQNGEFLEIADGRIDGTAFILMPFSAELIGNLDCVTDSFQGQAVNGISLITTFAGTLGGDLDRPTQTLRGDWSFTPDVAPTGSCDGPWWAARQP